MQRFQVPFPIFSQILPKYCIPYHRFKSNSIIIRNITIDPLAQFLLLLGSFEGLQIQAREVGTSSSAIGLDVDEEGGLDVAVNVRSIRVPVVMIFILVGDTVALDYKGFDVSR